MIKRKFPIRRKPQEERKTEFDTNYDKYVYLLEGYRKAIYEHDIEEKRRDKKYTSRAKKALKRGIIDKDRRERLERVLSLDELKVRDPCHNLSPIEEPLRRSHIFYMGPATSESLFNHEPRDFNYIENGRLPFEDCYFELLDSVETTLPGTDIATSIEGVQLSYEGAKKIKDSWCSTTAMERFKREGLENAVCQNYRFTSFMNSPAYGPTIFTTHLDVAATKEMQVALLYVPGIKKLVMYFGKLDSNPDRSKMCFDIGEIFQDYENPTFCHRNKSLDFTGRKIEKFDKELASSFIEKIYCFTVNMINYINSHNVTIVKRKTDEAPPMSHNSQIHTTPYNLITVKDEVIFVNEEADSDRHLEYRIYVRGHDRRLRDERGIIYRTTWVSPHIRGPENAPWREQRYQVLAEKLFREREFNRLLNERGPIALKELREIKPLTPQNL